VQKVSYFTNEIEKTVWKIIEKVRKGGDKALVYYSRKFDNTELKEFKCSEEKLRKAFEALLGEEKRALEKH